MDKMPRKLKKRFLGKKISQKTLRKLLEKVVVHSHASTMYEAPNISPGLFCPKCGCAHSKGTGNMAEYPEHWEYFHCLRCKYLVGAIDNSPFIHALEFRYNNFRIDF